jgi:hypothetical protein
MSCTVTSSAEEVKRVPPAQQFCDGCQSGVAAYKLVARPDGDGYVTRSMRLCQVCFLEMHAALSAFAVWWEEAAVEERQIVVPEELL